MFWIPALRRRQGFAAQATGMTIWGLFTVSSKLRIEI